MSLRTSAAVGRKQRRENRVCSQFVARNGEKMRSARNWPRATARRWHLLEVGRAQRREDGICLKLGARNDENRTFAGHPLQSVPFFALSVGLGACVLESILQ